MTAEGDTSGATQTADAVQGVGGESNRGDSNKTGASNYKGKGGGRYKGINYFDVSNKDFEGDTPEIGCVLGLRSEKMTKKVQFDTFREKLEDYLVKTLTSPMDIMPILKDMVDPYERFVREHLPKDLSAEEAKSPAKNEVFKQKIKKYVDRELLLYDNRIKIYAYVWGQCSGGLRAVISGDAEYKEKSDRKDVIWLLRKLKMAVAGLDDKANKYDTVYTALMIVITMRQGETEANDDYLTRFKANWETMMIIGGKHFFVSREIVGTQFYSNEQAEQSNEALRAMIFIKRSDSKRFGDLKKRLEEANAVKRDEYPKTLADAYDLLVRTQGQIRFGMSIGKKKFSNKFDKDRSGIQFAQINDDATGDVVLVAGIDGTKNPNITCWHCNKPGHGRDNCPDNPAATRGGRSAARNGRRGITNFMRGFLFSQRNRNRDQKTEERDAAIPSSWILLDTGSTVDVSNNKNHIFDLQPCGRDNSLHILTNGGTIDFTQDAELKLLPLRVHFNSDSMATIVSLATINDLDGYYTLMDSRKEKAILVYTPYGQVLKFKQCDEGLYYLDTNRADLHIFNHSSNELAPYSLLQTVSSNKEFLSKNEIEGAENARREQEIIGWPSTSYYKTYISNNLLNNSATTVDDINRAISIHGEPEPLLEGKMTRPKSKSFGKIERIPLPLPIKENYSDIQMHIDFFFVNRIPFLHTKSEKLNFLTVERMKNRTKSAIIGSLTETIRMYKHRGFDVTTMHGDGEFDIEQLKEDIAPTEMIVYGKDQHVPIVERSIRTIKERCRTTTRAAPYNRYTALMTQHLVESRVSWLNKFPSKTSISQTMSPATIVLGLPKPDMNINRIPFGSYAMAYTRTRNDMSTRSIPGIALSEANEKGGAYFMSLYTGRKIHAFGWKELPIHEDVINRVEQLAEEENQPTMNDRVPLFEWEPGREILDDENEEEENNEQNNNEEQNQDEEQNDDEGENVVTDDDESDASNDEAEDNDLDINEPEEINHEHDEAENQNIVENEPVIVEDVEDEDLEHEQGSDEAPIPDEAANSNRPRRAAAGAGVEKFEPGFDGKSYELNRRKQYFQYQRKKKHVQLMHVKKLMSKVREDQHAPSYLQRAVNVIFAQLEEDERKFKDMPASKGIKMFGERAVAAVIKEFSQLSEGVTPGKPVIQPVDPSTITAEEMKQALEAVNLIKQKRCGKIKMRSCANGSEQWKYMKEGESVASPTLQLEALFLSLIIDVFEGRDVAIFDIPGAYLHAEMPEDKIVLMRFRGQFVDIMCQVNPEHKKNVIYENGKKVLYVRVVRAIYGCIESALLWYNLYVSTLKEMGFELNPYDKCVANKEINGSQCTICWYVDDNKLSHKDPKVVTNILNEMESKFGKLTTTRGKEHTFLGMKLKIKKNKTFEVDMVDQVKETIQAFGEEIEGEVKSPAAKYLLNVPDDDEDLDDERKERFHSVVAKLLYIMKRARPDLETGVAFLCTRVTKCTMSDWKKLKRVLQYAKCTVNDVRVIGATSLKDIFIFVDASYAVYDNMRGVTGGCMSMGFGVFHAKSSKQKLNTKSSTETELVGTSEYVPFNLWALNFLVHQGYLIDKNVLFQDNQSAMLMEVNGRNSCTGNSRHIDIRYFFVKDRVDKGEISVEYCPTYLMIADYFTKPLQGRLFKLFRDVIMGYRPLTDVLSEIPSKERVGNGGKNRIVNEISRKQREEKTLEKLTGIKFDVIEKFDEKDAKSDEREMREKQKTSVRWQKGTQF